MKLLLCLWVFASPLVSQEMDRTVKSYERREKKRVDRYDFSGDWPNIENIDIDAKRKKSVEIDLSGKYPLLETIHFDGGFGSLKGKITGEFPRLSLIEFLCGSSNMVLNFCAQWQQSCEITVRGATEDVTLLLPPHVGLVVHTKVGPRGKVIVDDGLKKKGFGFFKKNYRNALADSASVVLHIHVETSDGRIILSTQ